MLKNKYIENNSRKINKNIVIGIGLLVLGIILFIAGSIINDNEYNNRKDLNTIISSKDNKVGLSTYIEVQRNPYLFAGYEDTTDSYYFVTDGTYVYVAYMSKDEFNELYDDENYTELKKIEGVTKEYTKDVKELAIDAYNELIGLTDENKLSLSDFENYFGSVYIDTTTMESDAGVLELTIGILLALIGLIVIILMVIKKIMYNKKLKKIDKNLLNEINNEMNDKEAFYYESINLCLTKNYVINFGFKFQIIPYKDIVWIYEKVLRTNGIKTSKGIMLVDKNNKLYNICSIDVISKNKKGIFEEVWNTIVSKNDKVLIGYTKENIDKVKLLTKK